MGLNEQLHLCLLGLEIGLDMNVFIKKQSWPVKILMQKRTPLVSDRACIAMFLRAFWVWHRKRQFEISEFKINYLTAKNFFMLTWGGFWLRREIINAQNWEMGRHLPNNWSDWRDGFLRWLYLSSFLKACGSMGGNNNTYVLTDEEIKTSATAHFLCSFWPLLLLHFYYTTIYGLK